MDSKERKKKEKKTRRKEGRDFIHRGACQNSPRQIRKKNAYTREERRGEDKIDVSPRSHEAEMTPKSRKMYDGGAVKRTFDPLIKPKPELGLLTFQTRRTYVEEGEEKEGREETEVIKEGTSAFQTRRRKNKEKQRNSSEKFHRAASCSLLGSRDSRARDDVYTRVRTDDICRRARHMRSLYD